MGIRKTSSHRSIGKHKKNIGERKELGIIGGCTILSRLPSAFPYTQGIWQDSVYQQMRYAQAPTSWRDGQSQGNSKHHNFINEDRHSSHSDCAWWHGRWAAVRTTAIVVFMTCSRFEYSILFWESRSCFLAKAQARLACGSAVVHSSRNCWADATRKRWQKMARNESHIVRSLCGTQ